MKANEMARRLRKAGILLWSNEGGVTRPILSGSSVADQIEHDAAEIERLYRLIDGLYDEGRRFGSDLTDIRCALDGLLTESGLDGENERDDKERVAALRGLIGKPAGAASTCPAGGPEFGRC
jgi:hypothetical protein